MLEFYWNAVMQLPTLPPTPTNPWLSRVTTPDKTKIETTCHKLKTYQH